MMALILLVTTALAGFCECVHLKREVQVFAEHYRREQELLKWNRVDRESSTARGALRSAACDESP